MASETQTRPWSQPPGEAWPPDDTEESVVGTDLHQMTIMNLRWGLNEAAQLRAIPGQAAPWQALSQTMATGFERPDGSRYRTLPGVFVYRQAIDQDRESLAVGVDGPPIFIVEVLSELTYDADLDIVRGKGYSYAHAGVQEYLALDPRGAFIAECGRAWQLREGLYQPWEPSADGRWHSARMPVAIGLEGLLATVYTDDGQRMPHEGEIEEERARIREELARNNAELVRLRRLLDEQQGKRT